MPSKLSLHINFITEADAMRNFILTARPAAVKTLHHDPGFWREIKAEYPELLLIGRYFVDDTEQGKRITNPKEAARWLVESKILKISDPHVFDAWEGFNELARDDKQVWQRMGLLDGEAALLLHKHGLKYVAGSHGVGHPTRLEFVTLGEIADGWAQADFIGAHEYCAPSMNDPRGMDAENPGTGWFTLRYRKWYPLLPKQCQKPLIIGECGIDSGAAHWDPGAQGGWRSFTNPEGYLGQLKWYDGIVCQDAFVKAAAIFCWGTLDPKWASFCLSGKMAELLRQWLRTQNPPVPQPGIEKYIGDTLQGKLLRANPDAGFQKYARAKDLGAARSNEIGYEGELVYQGRPILAQVFMRERDLSRQFIVWAYLDDPRPWDVKIQHFERPN